MSQRCQKRTHALQQTASFSRSRRLRGESRRGKIEAEHSSGLELTTRLVFGRRLQCEHFKQP